MLISLLCIGFGNCLVPRRGLTQYPVAYQLLAVVKLSPPMKEPFQHLNAPFQHCVSIPIEMEEPGSALSTGLALKLKLDTAAAPSA